jgi:2-oxo-4-hydroxy-4-carboxy--5-ureidoimidazoline (OHCU) decarboxylase
MIVGLNETYKEGFLMPYLLAAGENQNIMFTLLDQLQASDIL